MYRLLVILFLTGIALTTLAAEAGKKPVPVASPQVVHTDASQIKKRRFNEAALNRYRDNSDFNYTEETQNRSWWDRFWAWIWQLIVKLFGNSSPTQKASPPVIKYVMLVVVVGLLVFAIIKLLGKDLAHLFGRESKGVAIPYEIASEDIHQITFDEEISKALLQRNYRLAIRFLYLRSLKQLSDAQLIHWQPEKTNTAYLNELTDSNQRQLFGVITRQFEYAWYGDFPVNEQSFQNISTLFQDFKQQVA